MASKSKRVNSKPDGKADRYMLKESDYELIVSFLEEPENFTALFGSRGKTKIGGKHQTKTTAFAIMSMQLQSLGFPPCSATNLYKKVTCYCSRYESALSILKQTGSGLTDEEIARGLTLEAKLNKACPFFYQMDTVFGTKANMVPLATCELGIPEVPTMQVISEDENYKEEEDLTCSRTTGENPTHASYTEALSFIVAGKKPAKDAFVADSAKDGFVADSQVEMSPIQEEDTQNVHDKFSPDLTDHSLNRSALDGGSDDNISSKELQKEFCRSDKRQVPLAKPSKASVLSVKQKTQPQLKGDLQSILAAELQKKEAFRKSLLEAKLAILQE
ncbi:hypothetical protein R1flu_026209 [Riccia fluitans]|uniref:Uncharacterized protein n=1 Tax=Riccia fluitans TaxID=41844 RepID=A0ABD1XI93_9MARC